MGPCANGGGLCLITCAIVASVAGCSDRRTNAKATPPVRGVGGEPCAWSAQQRTYSSWLDGDELVLSPATPSRRAGALRLHTVFAGRSLAASPPESGLARTLAGSSVVLHHAAVEERLESFASGVEQSWTFAAPPGGSGDLLVRVRIDGERFASADGRGMLFTDGVTGTRMRYGNATWVDARGTKTPVLARYVDGVVELRVASAVVEASAFPAVLDPSIGPEFALDPPVYPPIPNEYANVAVGYGAGTYLVAWLDNIAPIARAVRVRASDATLLDTTPIALGAMGTGDSFAITSDGTNFLVAWSGGAERIAIATGALVDGSSGFSTPTGTPAVTYSPSTTSYLEAWSASTNLDELAIPVSTGVSGSTTTVVHTGAGNLPALAAATGSSLLAWADARSGTTNWDIYVTLPALSNFRIAHAVGMAQPAAASNGTDYFVVWNAGPLTGTRVRASDGTVLDSAGIALGTSNNPSTVAQVSFDGSNYVVAYGANHAAYVVRISPVDGSLLDGAPASGGIMVASGTGIETPVIASSSTESLVVWVSSPDGVTDSISAARVRSSDGAVLDGVNGFTVVAPAESPSPMANSEMVPAIASDGTNYLVAWLDNRDATILSAVTSVYGMLVRGSDGALLDTSAISFPILQIAPDTSPIGAPGLAFDGTHYVAGELVTTHVDPTSGAELDLPNGIAAAGRAAACVNGTCLVVGAPSSVAGSSFSGTLIRASDGALLDAAGSITLTSTGTLVGQPLVVAGTSSFLVAWVQDIGDLANASIQYDLVGLTGTVTSLGALAPPPASGETAPYGTLSLLGTAFDGVHYFVTYSCAAEACTNAGQPEPAAIFATRILESDGSLVDGAPYLGAVMVDSQGSARGSAVYDGQNFVLTYLGTPGVVVQHLRGSDLTLLDPLGGTPVTSGSVDNLAIASVGQGRSFLVYSKTDPVLGVSRVDGQLLDEGSAAIDAGGGLADGAVNPPDASLAGGSGGDGGASTPLDAETALVDGQGGGPRLDGTAPSAEASTNEPDATASMGFDASAPTESRDAGGSGGGGCATSPRAAAGSASYGLLWALGLLWVRRRRTRPVDHGHAMRAVPVD